MKFSLFFGGQLAEPSPEAERKLYRDMIEQALLAEELGYHTLWTVEHHGFYQCSHVAAPELFLAYLAAKTKRVRLGHGVTLLPHRYNHPIRVAERIATLDILSEGRVEWGTGKSNSLVEAGAFEIDFKELHAQWAEAIEMIPRMWSSDVFQHKGKYFDIPPTQIIPKPVQKPHPPIHVACNKPQSVATAGRMGLGALNFTYGTDEYLGGKVAEYKAAIAAAKPVGRSVTNQFSCAGPAMILDDDKKACVHGFRGARFFSGALAQYYMSGTRPVGRLPIRTDDLTAEELADSMKLRGTEDAAGGVAGTAIVGDPAFAREAVTALADLGIDELILVMQLGTVPQEIILESLRTFAEKVIPHFS
jgi:alkanesulfonate monooxygenase SsuD/methylene tetrahydromethanopterin reductase-like flavin-dependent oxidoreductase (luciferase family)